LFENDRVDGTRSEGEGETSAEATPAFVASSTGIHDLSEADSRRSEASVVCFNDLKFCAEEDFFGPSPTSLMVQLPFGSDDSLKMSRM
jgi:hypothetical protein